MLPALNEVARLHPGIVIDIRLSDELADVVDGQIDVGVRMGLFKDNRFVVRKVGSVGFGVYGSQNLIVDLHPNLTRGGCGQNLGLL